ncbi:hypothetical protein [Nonomuraea sp. NEAU-A123]|uniref:hypothetical protein n=1 Tax=Nonomuraea sp. NEAU-A123 TaxID=2839649 RepID=UPI0027E0782C|nr:hypothetical protein [Nonomuraea sp. NEAU-A123]
MWDACTSAEHIPRWFLPIEGDLRAGGCYRLEGNAGGEVLACEPPRHPACGNSTGRARSPTPGVPHPPPRFTVKRAVERWCLGRRAGHRE